MGAAEPQGLSVSAKAKKLLIIDGYNVLRSGRHYAAIEAPDYTDEAFNQARERLINDTIEFAGHEWEAVIVFDGARNEFSVGQAETVGGIRVVFSPAGISADHVIERLAHDARERGVATTVVTSDSSVQDTVFGGGIDRMSAGDFSWEIEALHAESELDASPKVAKKNTLAERLDPEALSKLEALRHQSGEQSSQ